VYEYAAPDVPADRVMYVEQSKLSCTPEQVVNIISRYLGTHRKHFVQQDLRELQFADYADLLHYLPEYAITLGVIDLVKDPTDKWFPTVGQVEEAAKEHLVEWKAGEEFEK
tara:strand:- start:2416 stop:2748 length:333 start_codon:yes stop_codon:yes gene_type:complete